MAGATGITAVPIQNIQPFDYVLAHTTVNHTYGLTASTDNTFTGLASEDLYTSTQQKQRDQFEFNETDWYEVSFRELHGGSYCKLALHKDWMNQHGMNEVGSIHDLNLPEQGISGPNIITSIKHILPQKIPTDENPTDDYDIRPVTGIFAHESKDVWTLRFDNGDSLGLTFNHPIYSATHRDWRLAGELEPGERLLAKSGEITLASKEKLPGTHTVYNLEVRELHNFLVGDEGVVVHNTGNCFGDVKKFLEKFNINHIEVSGKSGATRIGNEIILPDGRKVPISPKEFPNLTEFTLKKSDGTPCAPKFENLKGNDNRKFDNDLANGWLESSGILDEYDSFFINQQFGTPVKLTKNGVDKYYTWHHHENGKTMMLVEQDVHNKINHTGGAALIAKKATLDPDFGSLFPDPKF